MSTLRAVVVCDDELAASELATLLHRLGFEAIDQVPNLSKLKHLSTDLDVDLVISCAAYSSGQLGYPYLKEHFGSVPLIIVTKLRDEYSYQALLSLKPSAIISYPFDRLTMRNAVENALGLSGRRRADVQASSAQDTIFIKQANMLHRVKFEEILWIHAEGNYVSIQVQNKKFVAKSSLKKLLDVLPAETFLRVHRSYIVNLHRIQSVNLKTSTLLIQDNEIHVGRTYRRQLRDKLQNL